MQWVGREVQPEHVLDIFGGQLLVALEDISFRAVLEAQFMNKGHFPVSDESNKRVFGNKVDALLETIFEFRKLLRTNAGVDHQEEDGLTEFRVRPWQDVLDSGEVWHQLGGELLLGDVVCIVLGEGVLILTRATLPGFISKVDLAVGVQDGRASSTGNRLVLNKRHIFNLFKWCIHASDGYHNSGSSYFVARPEVP